MQYLRADMTPIYVIVGSGSFERNCSGLLVAGVFHNSRKTMTLLFVLIVHRLDLAIGTTYIRNAVVIGFITNELISIVENAGFMGIPLPPVINRAIEVLTNKSEVDDLE